MAKKTNKLKAQGKPPEGNKSWYKLKASAEAVTLFLYGYIGEWEISAEAMLRELLAHDGKDLTIRFHSYGGEVDEGVAIYAALKDYKGTVTGVVDSVCASITTLILAGCDKRYIRPQARIMMHQCHGWAQGTAADFRARADEAEIINDQMMQAFADATGQPLEKIIEDTKESDYWLGAQDSVEYGLCHGIYEGESSSLEASIPDDLGATPEPNTIAFRKMQALRAAVDADALTISQEEPVGDSSQREQATTHTAPLTAEKDDMSLEKYKEQEKQRRQGINQLFAKHTKAKKLKAECLDDLDCDVETARIKLLAFLEPTENEPEKNAPQSPTVSGQQQTGLTASAAKQHLSNYFGSKLKACKWEDDNPYRHMSATEALRAYAGHIGDTDATQMSKKKLVAHAFTNNTHSLGDIIETHVSALIINEVANLEPWHTPLVTRQPMQFGTNDILIMNDLGKPGVKTEGGKFTQVKLKASGDTAVLSTLGYEIQVSRELIMSDKFDFITNQVQKAVKNCAQAPADSLFALLKSNPTLKDGKKLFSQSAGNEITGLLDPATLADMSGKMADAKTSEGNPLYLKPDTYLTSNQRAKKVRALMKAETIKDEPNEAFEAFENVQGLADLAGENFAFAFANKEHVSFIEGYHEDAEGVQVETKEDWKSDGATIRIYIDSVIKAVDRKGVQKHVIEAPAAQ